MKVRRTHHIDASELDENGYYDYYYEYDVYEFEEDGLSIIVRCYSDTPEEANFLCTKRNGEIGGFRQEHVDTYLFKAAVEYLRSEGKSKFMKVGGNKGNTRISTHPNNTLERTDDR